MYSQFQSRYPTGSLISRLLQIHEGHYVVQAEVQVGGLILATGLAAAATIEQAEDQARARALVILGIHLPLASYESQAHLMGSTDDGRTTSDRPPRLKPATTDHDSASDLRPSADRRAIQAQAASLSQEALQSLGLASGRDTRMSEVEVADWTWSQADELDLPESMANLDDAAPEMEVDLREPEISTWQMSLSPEKEKAAIAKPDPSQRRNGHTNLHTREESPQLDRDEPIDLSEIIAQTSIELKRLGWTDARGRTHLQQTYNKRSRQQLTDEELLEFLHYLKAQPAANEPSF